MDNCTVCPFVKYWYVVLAVAVAVWAVYKFTREHNTPPPREIAGVVNLSAAGFESAVASGVTLVDFWAPWCGPCRMQLGIVAETVPALPDGVRIAKVNIDEARGVAERFGVNSVPTWIVFRDGKQVGRAEGVQGKEDLLKLAEAN
ncbi:MAG: thioredoxin family protein [Victivallaceae bacterium]